jgi:hypothetical protein
LRGFCDFYIGIRLNTINMFNTKDLNQLAEVYLTEMLGTHTPEAPKSTSNTVPSEAFKNSYCIFIDRNKANGFNSVITKQGLKDKGVRVLKGTWEPDATACIVIPNTLDYKKIEEALYKLPGAKHGFWGQMGMGYEGKSWEVI